MKILNFVNKPKKVEFKDIPVNGYFYDSYNDNQWIKKSSRTATLLFNNRTFYFSQDEVYTINILFDIK